MALAATEQSILKVVAESKKASVFQINRQTGLSLGYVEYLCSYLVRGGYLKSLGRGLFSLAPKGKGLLVTIGYGLGLDKDLIKELASQVAKEVAKEIRIKGGVWVTPKEEEEREKVQIKTDYTFPVEDESLLLKSNIYKIGPNLKKERSDIDSSVKLFKKIGGGRYDL